jgi:hypothetical protein
LLENLKNAFHKHDSILHDGKARGVISKVEAAQLLKDFWPHKSATAIEQMQTVKTSNFTSICFCQLFSPTLN